MANTNKIIKHGLEDEVIRLNDLGVSRFDIATQIQTKHKDIKDLNNLSPMSVQRFLANRKVSSLQERLNSGEDLEEQLHSEFRDRMYDLDDDVHDILKEVKLILKEVKQSKNPAMRLAAADKSLKAVDQVRKNWVSLIQFGIKLGGNIEKAQEKNIINVDKLLVNVSRDFCPKCRKVMLEKIITVEEDK